MMRLMKTMVLRMIAMTIATMRTWLELCDDRDTGVFL